MTTHDKKHHDDAPKHTTEVEKVDKADKPFVDEALALEASGWEPPTAKKAAHAKSAKPERPICSVCGQYEGEMTGSAGAAKWHAACETARPDVIRKVKSRA